MRGHCLSRIIVTVALDFAARRIGTIRHRTSAARVTMYRRLEPAAACLAALMVSVLAAQSLHAQDGANVRIKGDAGALQLDVHQATLAEVLTALSRFNIRYRSQSALNGVIDGSYGGSLAHVLSRVLDGYNYAIKQSDAKLDVIVVGRRGEQASSAPIIIRRGGGRRLIAARWRIGKCDGRAQGSNARAPTTARAGGETPSASRRTIAPRCARRAARARPSVRCRPASGASASAPAADAAR